MGPYFFLLGSGHLPHSKVDKIVQKHNATLVNYTEPNGEKRHWFECQNLGAPFDENRARTVKTDLVNAGILK